MNATLVAVTLIEQDGKYLLVQQARSRRQPGKWGPPGGKPEHDLGETLFEAAIREAKEETGLDIELTGFVGLLRSGHHTEPNLFICFAGRLKDRTETMELKAGEINASRWFTLEEIESGVVPLRAAPFPALFRRLQEGKVYPLELVQHEEIDPA